MVSGPEHVYLGLIFSELRSHCMVFNTRANYLTSTVKNHSGCSDGNKITGEVMFEESVRSLQ